MQIEINRSTVSLAREGVVAIRQVRPVDPEALQPCMRELSLPVATAAS